MEASSTEVVTVFLTLVTVIVSIYFFFIKKTETKKNKQVLKSDKLLKHESLRSSIHGCIKCGREVVPGENIYVCGKCVETYTLCVECRESDPNYHKHSMFLEPVLFEVETSSLLNPKSVPSAIRNCFKLWYDRPLLGCRRFDPDTCTYDDKYSWFSYEQVYQKILQLGSVLNYRLSSSRRSVEEEEEEEKTQDLSNRIVILFSAASVEWYITQYTCFTHNFTVVPAHSSSSLEQIYNIISRCNPKSLLTIVTSKHVQSLVTQACTLHQNNNRSSSNVLFTVVLINDCSESYPASSLNSNKNFSTTSNNNNNNNNNNTIDDNNNKKNNRDNLEFYDFDSFINLTVPEHYKPSESSNEEQPKKDKDYPIMLMPTSGTSGIPKLTIMTDSMMVQQANPAKTGKIMVMFSHEPMRQSLDLLAKGGRIGAYSGSLARLHEDIHLLRPTAFGATPTFWNGLHQQYKFEVHEKIQNENKKDRNPQRSEEEKTSQRWQAERGVLQIWQKEKQPLGNRCKIVVIGGSASTEQLKSWIFECLRCVVVDGYGTTETGGLVGNEEVLSGRSLQLIDCPEMKYFTTDKPHPRGEVVAHTPRITPGYFNDEKATQEKIVVIGGIRFFRTGDIGEMIDGKIKLIDRFSSVFKLMQGVWVTPNKLEELYGASEYVQQIFIYGDPQMTNVGAAVVPSQVFWDMIPPKEQVEENKVKHEKILKDEFRKIANHPDNDWVKTWEVPMQVVAEYEFRNEGWSNKNGLLSTIGKLCRPELKKRYAEKFVKSEAAESISSSEDINQQTGKGQEDVKEEYKINDDVLKMLERTIPNFKREGVKATDRLSDFGPDSMALARLAQNIADRFNVKIPLQLLAKLPTLLSLQMYVLSGGDANLMEEIMNQNKESVITAEFNWENEVDTVWNEIIKHQENQQNHQTESTETEGNKRESQTMKRNGILLTGATGFFGAFLLKAILDCKEWQDRKVYCLVRGDVTRVWNNLEFLELKVEESVKTERVRLINGNVEVNDMLGMELNEYKSLVEEIQFVVHNAAMVNSVMSYNVLKNPNVIGTKNIIQFCLSPNRSGNKNSSFKTKQLYHISTIGILSGTGISTELLPTPSSNLYHISGYAQSKWVAEQIVYRAFEKLQIQGMMFRPGTIGGDSVSGACNLSDSIVRMMCGIAKEGIVCMGEDSPLPNNFHIVNADWAARVVVEGIKRCLESGEGDKTVVHIVGSRRIKLENIVKALRRGGKQVKEVEEEFRNMLEGVKSDHLLYSFRGRRGQKDGEEQEEKVKSKTGTANTYGGDEESFGEDDLTKMVNFLVKKSSL